MIVYTTSPESSSLSCYEKAKGEEFNPKTTKMSNFRTRMKQVLKNVQVEAR